MQAKTNLAGLLALSLSMPGCRGDSATAPETFSDASGSIRLIFADPRPWPRPDDRCESEHCRALIELIDGAETSVDLAVYGVRRQSAFLDGLRRAQARGVKLRAVVDRTLDGTNIYSGTELFGEVVGKLGSDLQVDRKATRKDRRASYTSEPKCARPEGHDGPLQCLAYDLGDACLLASLASREAIEGSESIMHNKYAVVDERRVWTGSSNISDSGTGGYNANVVAVIDSPIVAGWYTEEFRQMHDKGLYHGLKTSSGKKRVQLGNADVEVLFSPKDNPIRRGVQPWIRAARERIDIAVFFFTHKHLAEELIEAHKRGVRVRMILDATGATNEYTKHEALRAAGIPVKVENWGGKMHMKSAVFDDDRVIAGSMNWTSSGEYSNDENTLLIRGREHATAYAAFFDELWASIPDRWLRENPDPESLDSGTSCEDGSDNDFDGMVDADDPGCSENPPPLPPLLPWRIVPKNGRLTCDVGMDG